MELPIPFQKLFAALHGLLDNPVGEVILFILVIWDLREIRAKLSAWWEDKTRIRDARSNTPSDAGNNPTQP